MLDSQLGELLEDNTKRFNFLVTLYDKTKRLPRKSKKRFRKSIFRNMVTLQLQRKSLIENYL